MSFLEDSLSAIRHQEIDLGGADENPHRPLVSVWASAEGDAGHVVLSFGAMHGQQLRFAELKPEEACRLANLLQQMALRIEKIANLSETANPKGEK